jgi:hypothetical protein
MNPPLIIFPTPPKRHFPETEMEHFQRLAQVHEFDRRMQRREARRARLRSLIQRKAA